MDAVNRSSTFSALPLPASISLSDDYAHLFRPFATFAALALVLIYGLASTLGKQSYGGELPWVGVKNEWFSHLRAKIRSISNLHSMTEEGYNKYSKANKAFVAPNFIAGPEVVLPPNVLPRVLKTPEDILNVSEVHEASIQQKYTIGDPHIMGNGIHIEYIRKYLTRSLGNLTEALADELKLGFEEMWGTDTDNFREIKTMDSIMKIVARTSNRVYVGAPLCRNDEYLKNCSSYAQAVFGNGTLINNFPKWTHPVVGPLLTIQNRRLVSRIVKLATPEIQARISLIQRKRDGEKGIELNNDYLTWQIEESFKRDLPDEREPARVVRRLLVLNFVAIHTTTITSTACIFDLFSSPNAAGFIDGIREEVARVVAEDGGTWTKLGLGRMIRLDSAIKESMRLSTLSLRGLQRIVKPSEGLDIDGQVIPQGSRVAFPISSIHLDRDNYEDPLSYNAFRFSAAREAWDASKTASSDDTTTTTTNTEKKDEQLQTLIDLKNQSMVSISETFLSFGEGKHACPGRFFASNEIKILIAYMLEHYEIEALSAKPQPTSVADLKFPSSASIRVRRRAPSEKVV